MFQQSIFASEESRRPWTFSVSLLAQALLIAVAVLVPMLAKPMLPVLNAAIVSLQLPKPPRAPEPAPPVQQVAAVRPQQFSSILQQPTRMPERPAVVVEREAPVVAAGPSVPGPQGGVISRLGGFTVGPPPPPPPTVEPAPVAAAPIRVSSEVQAARIVHRVLPVYPPLAITAHISGVVRLQAMIATDGSIAELRAVSGHPMLIGAAIDAVKQWRYRPTVLNGRPVTVDTQIDVNFTLGP